MTKPRTPATLTFDCLPFEQADQTLVVFACSAKELWNVVQVNQREEDKVKGYQRTLSVARVEKIADWVDKKNFIPTSVLISFSHATLSRNKKKITVANRKDAGWVIDGQHRLTGGKESKSDVVLPVVAFTKLDIQGQINCFVTINKEQRGVSSSLYLELLKSLPGLRNPTDDAKARAVDLAHLLKQDEESPFHGKIVSTTSPKKGEISLTNFVRKVHPMLRPTGRLAVFSDDVRCKILNSYYKAVQQVFPAEFDSQNSVFFKTIGFGALMGVLPFFLDITINDSKGGFKTAHAVKTFKRIADLEVSSWRGLSGSGAEVAVTQDLLAMLERSIRTDEQTTIELD